MCNALLEKTIRQFLDEGRMFTGYDVTLETRQREKIRLHHNECRETIHEIGVLRDAIEFGYDMNGQTVPWSKTQIDMGQNRWAFVYHPQSLDPSGYQPKTVAAPNLVNVPVNVSTTDSAVVVATDSGTTDSGGKDTDGFYETDYRNRLLIPTSFVRDIGVNAGDYIHIFADSTNKKIVLTGDSNLLNISSPNMKSWTGGISTQRVERNGDLRLSGSVLRTAGFTGTKYKIEAKSKLIEICEQS